MSNQVTLDQVLDRLQGVRKSSHKRAMAQCPAHADSDPSLSVSEGSTCIIMHCFAGCDFVEKVNSICLEPQHQMYEITPDLVLRNPSWAREAEQIRQLNLEGGER
jgi:hypothetical protein